MLKSSDMYQVDGPLRAEALTKYSEKFNASRLSVGEFFDSQFMASLAGLLFYFLF